MLKNIGIKSLKINKKSGIKFEKSLVSNYPHLSFRSCCFEATIALRYEKSNDIACKTSLLINYEMFFMSQGIFKKS
ncbi:hypothetical protein ABIB62_004656 [Mucilaginibacter sp. UYP25]